MEATKPGYSGNASEVFYDFVLALELEDIEHRHENQYRNESLPQHAKSSPRVLPLYCKNLRNNKLKPSKTLVFGGMLLAILYLSTNGTREQT